MVAQNTQALNLGPLKLATGLQENGALGVILTGADGGEIGWFDSRLAEDPGAYLRGKGFYQFVANGGWQTATDSVNSGEIALRTSAGTFIGSRILVDGDTDSECKEVRVVPPATGPAADDDDDDDGPECIWINRDYALTTLFLDYAYRDTTVEGIRTRQQTISGGFALWYTDAVRASHNIVNLYPKLSVGYHHATDVEVEDASLVAAAAEPDYLVVRASVRLRLPTLKNITVGSKFLLDVDSVYSQARGSQPGDADGVAHTIQLLYDTGSSLKPALVYRSGQERAVEYDRQVLFGLVSDLRLPGS